METQVVLRRDSIQICCSSEGHPCRINSDSSASEGYILRSPYKVCVFIKFIHFCCVSHLSKCTGAFSFFYVLSLAGHILCLLYRISCEIICSFIFFWCVFNCGSIGENDEACFLTKGLIPWLGGVVCSPLDLYVGRYRSILLFLGFSRMCVLCWASNCSWRVLSMPLGGGSCIPGTTSSIYRISPHGCKLNRLMCLVFLYLHKT